jgi:hypothetical protein
VASFLLIHSDLNFPMKETLFFWRRFRIYELRHIYKKNLLSVLILLSAFIHKSSTNSWICQHVRLDPSPDYQPIKLLRFLYSV